MYKIVILFVLLPFFAFAKGSDPTKPLLVTSNSGIGGVTAEKLALQSILQKGDELTVIINGKLMVEGDVINEYRLTKITSRYVLLSSDDKDIELSLFSSVVNNSKKKDK